MTIPDDMEPLMDCVMEEPDPVKMKWVEVEQTKGVEDAA
jgi:hypothetical protein